MQKRFKNIRAGRIPEDWEVVSLKEKVTQFIVPMRDKPKQFRGDVPWCRIEDFSGIYLSTSKSGRYVDEKTIQSMNLKVYPVGTILVSCSANLGFCAITTQPLITNQTFIGLVPGDNISTLFLYYYMISSSNRLNRLSAGTTIAYLSRREFENFIIGIPRSLDEQRKIAAILSTVDDAIEKTDTIIEKTKQLKKGLMQKLFNEGIGHKRFKETRIGTIPEEWELVRLDSVCRGKAEYGAGESAKKLKNGLIRYIRITDINYDGNLNKDAVGIFPENAEKYTLKKGNFLFARTGATVGKTYLYNPKDGICAYAGYLIRFVPDEDRLKPEFLKYFCQTRIYWNWVFNTARSTAQPNINAVEYSRMKLPKPRIDEQQQIVKILSGIDNRISSEYATKIQLEQLKKGLMQVLLTGKVRLKV